MFHIFVGNRVYCANCKDSRIQKAVDGFHSLPLNFNFELIDFWLCRETSFSLWAISLHVLGDVFVCLESLILSFPCNFFAYFKFHSDWGRVIGKIKQNELDFRDTAPLSMRGMLLRYSSEHRPTSRALATAGAVMAIGLSTNGCWHSKKPVWREKTRLTSLEVQAAASSKVWRKI